MGSEQSRGTGGSELGVRHRGGRHRQALRPRPGAVGREPAGAARRGAGAGRRQRRRQVDADQDHLRRACAGRRPPRLLGRDHHGHVDPPRAGTGRRDRLPGPRAGASTSPSRKTCSSAASRSCAACIGGWPPALDRRRMRQAAQEAIRAAGITTLNSVDRAVRDLSGGQRQAIAVARAVMWAKTAILMDEPTAALGTKQTDIVYRSIRSAAAPRARRRRDLPRHPEDAEPCRPHRRHAARAGRSSNTPARDLTLTDVVTLMLGGTGHGTGGMIEAAQPAPDAPPAPPRAGLRSRRDRRRSAWRSSSSRLSSSSGCCRRTARSSASATSAPSRSTSPVTMLLAVGITFVLAAGELDLSIGSNLVLLVGGRRQGPGRRLGNPRGGQRRRISRTSPSASSPARLRRSSPERCSAWSTASWSRGSGSTPSSSPSARCGIGTGLAYVVSNGVNVANVAAGAADRLRHPEAVRHRALSDDRRPDHLGGALVHAPRDPLRPRIRSPSARRARRPSAPASARGATSWSCSS